MKFYKNIKTKNIFQDNWFNELVKGNIPIVDEWESIEKYILKWNLLENKNEIFEVFRELIDWKHCFYKTLKSLNSIICDILRDFFDIYNDFKYFEQKFKEDLAMWQKQYAIAYENGKSLRAEQINNSFIEDISSGIFSSGETQSRQLYFQITSKHTNEEKECFRKFNYLVDNFYSYLYIKTEQILHFTYILFEKRKEKLFLMDKYVYISKNSIFGINNESVKQKLLDDLNKIWKYYKHQNKLIDFSHYKIDTILEYLEYISNIYEKVGVIKELKKFTKNFIDFDSEIEGFLNPLGLTGFEND